MDRDSSTSGACSFSSGPGPGRAFGAGAAGAAPGLALAAGAWGSCATGILTGWGAGSAAGLEADGRQDLVRGLGQLLRRLGQLQGVQHTIDELRARRQVSLVDGFEGIHVVHVEHRTVKEIPDVRRFWVEDERREVEACSVSMLTKIGVCNGQVGPTSCVVGLQLEALVVSDHGLLGFPRVGQRGTELVPHRVVVWPQATGSCQRLNSAVVVPVDVLHNAECDKDVGIKRIRLCSLLEEGCDLLPPGLVLVLCRRLEALHESLVLLVVLDPHAQVAQRRQLVELVGAAHAQRQEAVEVVGVYLVAPTEALDGLDVLVELRVELAQLPPALGALGVPPDLGLQGQERLAVAPLPEQPQRLRQGLRGLEVGVLRGELVLALLPRTSPGLLHHA
mmetsp:Transcript_33746/g.101647  ORF Transcript_33746/g.101647 Transcript_33746/m.101647 type:complete len:391 (+) Transcript_33746:736-1908(+)